MTWVNPGFVSFQSVVSRAAVIIRDAGMREAHPEVLRQFASEACREFARLTEITRVQAKYPLISGQRLYDLPHDCLKPVQLTVIPVGYTAECVLDVIQETDILDGFSQDTQGTPDYWYMSRDRKRFGLYPVPSGGGFSGEATGGSTSTVVLPSSASSEDDFYNDLTIRMLTGNAEEQDRTISDYVGSTRTATVSSVFTGAVASGDRFQIHPDTVVLDYIQKGHDYSILPTTGTVDSGVTTIKPYQFGTSTGAFNRPKGYFNDCQIEFTSGALLGMKALIKSHTSAGATAIVTVDPEFPQAPANTDAFEVVQVPNVPHEYAHYLSDYIVHKAAIREHPSLAAEHRVLYLRGVEQAKAHDPNPQAFKYEGVNFHNWDDLSSRGW